MTYYYSKTVRVSFDEAVSKIKQALKDEGFGMLTEIDVMDTLKKKRNVEIRNYRILGTCNPPFAYRALQAEDESGTMLPCNVIVQEIGDGQIKVAAIDPIVSMQSINNSDLEKISSQVKEKLQKVINSFL